MAQRRVIARFHGKHDHRRCLEQALEKAEAMCAQKGLRLTRLRRQVLALVWDTHTPVRAYDILEGLRDKGHRPGPPTAYRALEFLQNAGLVHRIESMNAYVGCGDPMPRHRGQFFICDYCDSVAEIHDLSVARNLDGNAKRLGFHADYHTVEIHGICGHCRTDS